MKRNNMLLAATAAALVAAPIVALQPVYAHGPGGGTPPQAGAGMMGQGMMGGHMMGQGMMGGGMGHGFAMHQTDRNLTPESVKKFIEGMIAWHGNDRLKVGKVEQKDDSTIIAEIVTVDDSLVQRVEFDTKTGSHHMVR
ncbi:MAG: hypothetical protein OEY85_14410 [Rhodospirillales bacterium]|nr:hypothetical protein [Rhodospirillales bacterium]